MTLRIGPTPTATMVLPVYNAEAYLDRTLERVHRWLAVQPDAWELVVVDDASSDTSPAILERFAGDHPGDSIRIVRFAKNRGKGFAVRAGLASADGRFAVFTDCDLAYSLRSVPSIVRALEAGAGAAIACRVLPDSRYTMSPSFFSYLFSRHLMGRAFNLLCRILTLPKILDSQAGLKGFRTSTLAPLLPRLVLDGFSFDVELLRALTDNRVSIVEVPVNFRYDTEPSTVAFVADSLRMVRDLIRIRLRSLRGTYRVRREERPPSRLIVHADDFGLSPEVNHAIEENLSTGCITSTSILANLPHSSAAIGWAVAHPEFDFGVHLNLTEGRPVLPADRVPSLTGPTGEFHRPSRFLFRLICGRIRVEEIAAEWHAQVEVVRRAGVAVSHLDSHQHVHLIPRLFRRAAVPLADSLGVGVRTMDGPRSFAGWSPDLKGLALSVATSLSLRGRGRSLSVARGSGTTFMKRPSLGSLRGLLARMGPGEFFELVVHPSFGFETATEPAFRYPGDRNAEREILSSDDGRAAFRQSGLKLVSFREARALVGGFGGLAGGGSPTPGADRTLP